MNTNNTINLLWTGGWDSTFRLCQLLICYKKQVQPIYIIDPERKSVKNEFKAQTEIRNALASKFPYTKDLLLPTQIHTFKDFKISPRISQIFKSVCHETPFGSQYEWLAGYCDANNLTNLEISTEKVLGHVRWEFFKTKLIPFEHKGISSYRFNDRLKGTDFYELFYFFSMPLIETTRTDMSILSKKYDFYDILHLTWFCHRPLLSKPCGLCNPCKDAIKYGFAYRVGLIGRLRNRYPVLSLNGLKKLLK